MRTRGRLRARIFVERQQGATYDQQVQTAQAAERLGFDAFFRSDHYLAMAGDGLPGPSDAWTTLAGIARETSRVRLGTLLSSATFRLPGPLAITVAEVDAMSGGRVELGLGAGWFDQEHRAYGIPFPPTAERFDRLEEQPEIVTGLWQTPVGGRFSFDGRHYSLDASPALPKPVQFPHPPVIVGGTGRTRTPGLAVRFAGEFNVPPFHSLDDAAQLFARMHRACEDAGRDPSSLGLSGAVTVCCGTSGAEVAQRAAAIGEEPASLRRHGAVETPDQVAEHLRAYAAIGADTVYLQLMDMGDLDHLALIGTDVLPHL